MGIEDNKRMGCCYKCGNVFNIMEHLQASTETKIYGVRQMGEIGYTMENAIKAELHIKCPYCGVEFSQSKEMVE